MEERQGQASRLQHLLVVEVQAAVVQDREVVQAVVEHLVVQEVAARQEAVRDLEPQQAVAAQQALAILQAQAIQQVVAVQQALPQHQPLPPRPQALQMSSQMVERRLHHRQHRKQQ